MWQAGAICLSKEFSTSASVWMVTAISECWAKGWRGLHQQPSQCAQTVAFVARCTTLSELAELKLLSDNVLGFLNSKSYKSFSSTFQLLP